MSYLNSSCESWKAVEKYLQNSKGKIIFSLEFCSQMYYQLSVKVELSIFPDMQNSKFYLFCTFSPEARGMCTVPKREREREEKLSVKDMEFSKRGGWKKSLRAWVIGDGKYQSLEDNQFRLKQEKEGSGEKQN